MSHPKPDDTRSLALFCFQQQLSRKTCEHFKHLLMRNKSRDALEVRGQQWLLRLAMGDGEAPCDAEPVGWQVGMGSGDTTQCYTQPRDHPGRSKVLPVGLGLLDGGGRRLDADVAAAQLRLEISSFVFFFFFDCFFPLSSPLFPAKHISQHPGRAMPLSIHVYLPSM